MPRLWARLAGEVECHSQHTRGLRRSSATAQGTGSFVRLGGPSLPVCWDVLILYPLSRPPTQGAPPSTAERALTGTADYLATLRLAS